MRRFLIFTVLFILANIIYSQDGSFDTTFDLDGQIVTDINGNWDSCNDIIVQNDDKIIAVGASGSDLAVLRYEGNGNLDATFGTGGIKLVSLAGSPFPNKGVIQPDGKIIIFGSLTSASPNELFLAKLKSNGDLDSTFGNNGIALTNIGNDAQSAGGLKIQPDGKIIISGTTENYSPWNSDILLMRFNNDGSPDNTFGTSGQIVINVDEVEGNPTLDYGIDILLQTSGKIIVIGSTDISGSKVVLIRLNSDGSIDTNFGTNGYVFDFFNTTFDLFTCAAVQDDDKIIIGGQSSVAGKSQFALIKFDANGILDNSFGTSGKVMNTVDNFSAYANDIVIQNDGKIVLGGSIIDNTFNYAFAIARYNADGTLDTSFDSDGEKSFSFNSMSPPNDASAVAIQSTGKILMGGSVNNNSDNDIGMARLNSASATSSFNLSLNVLLEGPFNNGLLNSSVDLSGQLTQPYPSSVHDGTETVPSDFFTNHTDIVDWIIVELRTSTEATSKIASRAAFLKEDGSIVDIDGSSNVNFDGINSATNYYIVIHHRNHLSVMSSTSVGI